MTIRVGILGIGFMGSMHFNTYKSVKSAHVTAICDIDPKKRSGDWSAINGNIRGAGGKVDLSGIKIFAQAEAMFADPNLDVIDITLPTYLHAEYARKALRAGKHVICEKPLARSSAEGARVAAEAKKQKRLLFTAHCIRFWPAYAKAAELIQSGKYGQARSAIFRRLSPTPVWSWQNWLQDPKKSGLAALDLHVHDADYILATFGAPQKVSATANGFSAGRADHITATYAYKNGLRVVAEGAWDLPGGYPFQMSFTVVLEKATLELVENGKLLLYPLKGAAKTVKIPAGDGYLHELRHFIKCIQEKRASDLVTPASAVSSIRLIEAEMKSAAGLRVLPFRP